MNDSAQRFDKHTVVFISGLLPATDEDNRMVAETLGIITEVLASDVP